MKSRRIILASIAIGASRPPNKYSKNFVSPGLNMSAPITGPPNLAGNGSTGGGPSPPAGDDNSSDYNAHFNPSMAIIIVVLLSAFFFMAFFSIYIRRCTDEDDRERNSRRGGPLPNGNGRIDRTSQGLDRELIESFPIYTYSLVKGLKSGKESLECAVCLSEFEDDEQLRLLPKCSHTFHPDCIDMWLQSHTTCPVCRTSLVPGAGNGSNAAVGDGTDGSETGSGNGDQLVIVVQGSNTQGGEANACGSHDSPIFGLINSVGARARQKIRRSNSTGHSLVRAPSACNSKADRLVGLGQTSGIHRSSSCVNFSRNSQDSHGSSNCAGPSCSSRRSESGRVLGNETGNIDPRIIASERWSLSMNPSSFLRTFSERAPPHFRDQLSSCRSQAVKQDGNAYMQSLRRSIKWLTRRDPSAGSSRSSKNEMPTP